MSRLAFARRATGMGLSLYEAPPLAVFFAPLSVPRLGAAARCSLSRSTFVGQLCG
ncbi:hypothetical protein [Streptomyces sp. NPDC059928]|uniref:hypothetical protein n=1 Tax=unclassified Streptomyces TaxID=2593676 RepID=UPI00365C257B